MFLLASIRYKKKDGAAGMKRHCQNRERHDGYGGKLYLIDSDANGSTAAATVVVLEMLPGKLVVVW